MKEAKLVSPSGRRLGQNQQLNPLNQTDVGSCLGKPGKLLVSKIKNETNFFS